jgi:hypothetical protein
VRLLWLALVALAYLAQQVTTEAHHHLAQSLVALVVEEERLQLQALEQHLRLER